MSIRIPKNQYNYTVEIGVSPEKTEEIKYSNTDVIVTIKYECTGNDDLISDICRYTIKNNDENEPGDSKNEYDTAIQQSDISATIATKQIVISKNSTIYVAIFDTNGNLREKKNYKVDYLDKVAPVIQDYSREWISETEAKVRFKAFEETQVENQCISGISDMKITVYNSTRTELIQELSKEFITAIGENYYEATIIELNSSENYVFELKVEDAVGNFSLEGDEIQRVYSDKSKQMKIIYSKTVFTNENVKITLDGPQSLDGYKRVIKLDDGIWKEYTSSGVTVEKNCNIVAGLIKEEIDISTLEKNDSRISNIINGNVENIDKLAPNHVKFKAYKVENEPKNGVFIVTVSIDAKDTTATAEYAESGIKAYYSLITTKKYSNEKSLESANETWKFQNKNVYIYNDLNDVKVKLYVYVKVEDVAGNITYGSLNNNTTTTVQNNVIKYKIEPTFDNASTGTKVADVAWNIKKSTYKIFKIDTEFKTVETEDIIHEENYWDTTIEKEGKTEKVSTFDTAINKNYGTIQWESIKVWNAKKRRYELKRGNGTKETFNNWYTNGDVYLKIKEINEVGIYNKESGNSDRIEWQKISEYKDNYKQIKWPKLEEFNDGDYQYVLRFPENQTVYIKNIVIENEVEIEQLKAINIINIDKEAPRVNEIKVYNRTNMLELKPAEEDTVGVQYKIEKCKNNRINTPDYSWTTVSYGNSIIKEGLKEETLYEIELNCRDILGNTIEHKWNGQAKTFSAYKNPYIPEGYYYVGGTYQKGLVISDNEKDKAKYFYGIIDNEDMKHNQYIENQRGSQDIIIYKNQYMTSWLKDSSSIDNSYINNSEGRTVKDGYEEEFILKGKTLENVNINVAGFVWVPIPPNSLIKTIGDFKEIKNITIDENDKNKFETIGVFNNITINEQVWTNTPYWNSWRYVDNWNWQYSWDRSRNIGVSIKIEDTAVERSESTYEGFYLQQNNNMCASTTNKLYYVVNKTGVTFNEYKYIDNAQLSNVKYYRKFSCNKKQ